MNCAFHAAAAHSRALLRRARARSADESGQSLMEVVLAMMIFAIVASAMIVLLLSALKASNRSRQKTLAQQAAATQIEQIRNLQYSDIGNTAGNPPGTVPLTTTLTLNGLSATRTTKITYVNDPTPLSYQSYANYKKVSVTVTRSSDGHLLARDVTYIAPPVKASQSEGQIVATVVDIGNNSVVPNYDVDVAGPNSFSASDTSDNSGQVTFAALTPTGSGQYYDVTVPTASGYVPFKDTTPPASGVHFALAPSQTQAVTVDVYKPATIYVSLQNSDGTTYAGHRDRQGHLPARHPDLRLLGNAARGDDPQRRAARARAQLYGRGLRRQLLRQLAGGERAVGAGVSHEPHLDVLLHQRGARDAPDHGPEDARPRRAAVGP